MERQVIVDWINSFDCEYHLTLSFSYGTNEHWSRELLNRVINHMNIAILKNRYKKGTQSLTGFVIREHTYHKDCDHYHILIMGNGIWYPELPVMRFWLRKKIAYINKSTRTSNTISSYLLQKYYDDGDQSLEQYLTKEMEKPWVNNKEAIDSIGIIDRDNVVFGKFRFN